MDQRQTYHESILKQYMGGLLNNVNVCSDFTSSDEVTLNCTEIHANSKIGIVIIPGITVPRESYYKLLASLSSHNVLTFDLRGQSYSGGELNPDDCVRDINEIGAKFKKEKRLKYLIGIGHSFGGLSLLKSSLEKEHPYDLRITLAAPVDLKKASSSVPKFASLFIVYMHNILRAAKSPALRDKIVKEYQHSQPLKFFKDPRIVAMRVKNPSAFNRTRINAPNLLDFITKVSTPTHLFYTGNDTRLDTNGRLSGDYELLDRGSSNNGIEVLLIPGLSHRFNSGKEKEFMFSYNNELVIQRIKKIIKIYQ